MPLSPLEYLRHMLEETEYLIAGPCTRGVVLYNGEPHLTVNGIRIFNPLAVGNLTDELLQPSVREHGAPASVPHAGGLA